MRKKMPSRGRSLREGIGLRKGKKVGGKIIEIYDVGVAWHFAHFEEVYYASHHEVGRGVSAPD